MPRPKKPPGTHQDKVLGTKITGAQRRVWDELRRRLGGEIVPSDTLALRHVIADACKARGMRWPADDEPDVSDAGGPVAPPAPSAPARAKRKR